MSSLELPALDIFFLKADFRMQWVSLASWGTNIDEVFTGPSVRESNVI